MSEPKVDSVTPSPAAASPSHPDHDRWVKETTLAMEVAHAKSTGGTTRDAELANAKSLERLAGKKRELRQVRVPSVPSARPRIPDTPPTISVEERREQLRKKGVFVNPVAPVTKIPPSPCKHCGKCRRCKREARIVAINTKAREGDIPAQALAWDLTGALLALQGRKRYRGGDGREYDFSILRGNAVHEAFNAAVESVCDRSVKILGAWRP